MSIRIERMVVDGVDQVLYFGDENTDGSWRIVVSGDNLVIQKRESSVWVEKSSFTP